MPLMSCRWFYPICFLLEEEEGAVAEGACEVFGGEEI